MKRLHKHLSNRLRRKRPDITTLSLLDIDSVRKKFFSINLKKHDENDRIHIRKLTAKVLKEKINTSVKETWRDGRFFEAFQARIHKATKNRISAAWFEEKLRQLRYKPRYKLTRKLLERAYDEVTILKLITIKILLVERFQ